YADLLKGREDLVAFHRLGDRRDAEQLADLVDRFDQRALDRAFVDVAHEAAVDLQEIDVEVLEVRERRQAGAEIVEHKTAAARLQGADELLGAGEVRHRRGFGHLEQDARGRNAGEVELLDHVVEEALLVDRSAREVDRPVQLFDARPLLHHQVLESVFDHPAIDAGDQAVALRGGNERAGQRDLTLLVAHPDEDLRHLRPAVLAVQRADLLAEQKEPLLVQGVLNPVDPLHRAVALDQRGVVLLVFVDPAPAALFGDVAGGVGRGEQLHPVGSSGGDRHQADRNPDLEAALLPGETEGADGGADLLRDAPRAIEIRVFEQDAELVAAEPREDVVRPDPRSQQGRQLAQQLVSRQMPRGVVDQLELVEVEVEQRVSASLAAGARDAGVDQLFELAPVDQSGELVVAREVGHLALHPANPGDVLEHQDGAANGARGVADRGHRILDGELDAIAANQGRAARQLDHPSFRETGRDRIETDRPAPLVHQLENPQRRLALRLDRGPPGEMLGDRIEIIDAAFRIGADHAVADRGEGDLGALPLQLQAILVFPQRDFRFL